MDGGNQGGVESVLPFPPLWSCSGQPPLRPQHSLLMATFDLCQTLWPLSSILEPCSFMPQIFVSYLVGAGATLGTGIKQ